MKIDKTIVGNRIKNIRLEKGMNKTEFGQLLSTSGSIVARWEKGTQLPNPERLKTIAKLGDTTVEELTAPEPVGIDLLSKVNELIETRLLEFPYTEDEKSFISNNREVLSKFLSEKIDALFNGNWEVGTVYIFDRLNSISEYFVLGYKPVDIFRAIYGKLYINLDIEKEINELEPLISYDKDKFKRNLEENKNYELSNIEKDIILNQNNPIRINIDKTIIKTIQQWKNKNYSTMEKEELFNKLVIDIINILNNTNS
ncbi:helix-turn-helix transcriptional regulator [Peptostreptococcus porci]|uniref:helix-turn-helix domain-containing protein n=1 Tax=Peptostreptococcus porci TaxID=2652282 RepID=UPI002A822DDF|nr:helix-turn-helix transcriptional regulator [Peptostreptococcus porci]MDY4127962.1 helix-turn-helix transcriptional regulator [Peptostreptococcus porci]